MLCADFSECSCWGVENSRGKIINCSDLLCAEKEIASALIGYVWEVQSSLRVGNR